MFSFSQITTTGLCTDMTLTLTVSQFVLLLLLLVIVRANVAVTMSSLLDQLKISNISYLVVGLERK